jgi:dolichol kinase
MWSEIKRKLFHLAALVYVVGIITLPRGPYVAGLAVLLGVAAVLEALRLTRPAVNDWFFRRFGGLFRPAERERVCGATFMVAGVLVATALLPPDLAGVAVLYLVLGDAVASIVGVSVQGPAWPGTQKRLSGSLACFVVCLAVGAALLPPGRGWAGALVGAAVATALEAGIIPGDDNLIIPAGSAVALLLTYGRTW